jgi:hypothetical protein
MDARDRFNHTMTDQVTDRPPLFEDGIRDEVLRSWHKQGLGRREKLESLFCFDKREEIEPDLEPIPYPGRWPKTLEGLKKLTASMSSNDSRRLPDQWEAKVHEWASRDYPLILRVHRGYFLSMGVHGWRRFSEAIQLLIDNLQFVETWLAICAELSAGMLEKVLREVQVDAVLFSEPIGGNHGPLISPRMYSSIVLKSYKPILDVIMSHGVNTIIYRTYANTRLLLPHVVDAGFNCLWACETNPQAMDYQLIRKEFGKDLRLIGGIDADALRQDQAEITQAVFGLVPELLNQGGYIPLADGRVREDVPYRNYVYYRNLLESIVMK